MKKNDKDRTATIQQIGLSSNIELCISSPVKDALDRKASHKMRYRIERKRYSKQTHIVA